jgi:hypothetical protein
MPRFHRFQDAVDHLLSGGWQATAVADVSSDFEALEAALQRDALTIDHDPRCSRARVIARSLMSSTVRYLGLFWRPARVRVLSVYHADHFKPIYITESATTF